MFGSKGSRVDRNPRTVVCSVTIASAYLTNFLVTDGRMLPHIFFSSAFPSGGPGWGADGDYLSMAVRRSG